jgi:hypothetical protein
MLLMFIGSLFALLYMRNGLAALSLISCMTLFLALSMAMFTRSSRFEIFVAIIGYGNLYPVNMSTSHSLADTC